MKDGEPIKGKKGWVYFKNGQLKIEEYERWQKEQARVVAISLEEKQELEFEEERKKSETETVSKAILIKAFETDTKKRSLAANCKISISTVDNWCQKYFGKSYRSAKQAYLSRKRAMELFYPETVEMPSAFEDRITGAKFKDPRDIVDKEGNYIEVNLNQENEILKNIEGKPLCPILANEVSNGNWRGYLLKENQIFHETVTDLPYYQYNPIKRLRRAAASWLHHGEFDRQMQQEKYFGESKSLIYLTVRFAKTPEELYLTHDDGLIISEKASIAMSYNFLEKDDIGKNIITKTISGKTRAELEKAIKLYPADRRIEAGDLITSNFDFPTDGYMSNPDIRGRKHFTLRFGVFKHGQISVGDKLLGLTGLRGVVCKVDPNQKEDLVINPKQAFGEKETRKCGSLIKEIKTTGRLAIFFQPRQLASSKFSNIRKGVTISNITYPFISLYGSEELKNKILINHRLADLFYMLDLVLDKEGRIKPVNRQVKARANGEIEPFRHYLWNKSFIKKEIWIPKWLPRISLQKGSKESGVLHETPTNLMRAISGLAKVGKISEIKRSEEDQKGAIILFNTFKKEIAGELLRNAPPRIQKGRSNVVAVSKTGKPDEVELTKHDLKLLGLKDGERILIRREPVVTKYHIQEFAVRSSGDRFQQNNTIKIAPEAIRLMLGDFDGDILILMCYPDENFRVPEKTYTEERKRMETEFMSNFDISKIKVEELYKTDDELINMAEIEHKKQKIRKTEAPKVGGYRRGASFSQNSKKFEKEEIVNYAIYLEEDLKDAQSGKFILERSKSEQKNIWKEAGKGKFGIKLIWRKTFWEGDPGGKLLDDILGLKFLPDSKDGLYQHLISEIERQ